MKIGKVTIGDTISLLERANPRWPLGKVIAARFNPHLSPRIATALAGLPELAGNWKKAFTKKGDLSFVENTDERLNG